MKSEDLQRQAKSVAEHPAPLLMEEVKQVVAHWGMVWAETAAMATATTARLASILNLIKSFKKGRW